MPKLPSVRVTPRGAEEQRVSKQRKGLSSNGLRGKGLSGKGLSNNEKHKTLSSNAICSAGDEEACPTIINPYGPSPFLFISLSSNGSRSRKDKHGLGPSIPL